MFKTALIGKEQAFNNLLSSFKANRLPHALVISGEKGIGKKFFAKEICKMLVCRGENVPCSECAQCEKTENGVHPDIFNIFPSGKSQTIGVKDIEVVFKNAYIKPNDADFKVFIINNAERMNRFSQNALLKIIEEPPEYLFFLFTCENTAALLPTVRSRLTEIRLSPASILQAEKELLLRFPETDKEKIKKAAEKSRGNIGLGIELCENDEMAELYEDAEKIIFALCDKDRAKLCLELGKYSKKKEESISLVSLLKLIFRDTCAKLSREESRMSGCENAVNQLSKYAAAKGLLNCMQACDDFLNGIYGNSNLALSLAAFEIKLTEIIKR